MRGSGEFVQGAGHIADDWMVVVYEKLYEVHITQTRSENCEVRQVARQARPLYRWLQLSPTQPVQNTGHSSQEVKTTPGPGTTHQHATICPIIWRTVTITNNNMENCHNNQQ